MAQNYTKMWDAFLGGEYEGYDAESTMADQERDFYRSVIGPAFGLTGFGDEHLEGVYAAFTDVDFEKAERTFRSEIGDPYGGGAGDPFSWEKVSRYNTEDFEEVGRLQDLLEDELYGQGKFLGGQTGADYGTATAKGLEAYSSGLRGERESLSYEGLREGSGLVSSTGGSVLRSGESASVAEDVLIEAYKKAKTLGSDYRAGSKKIEEDLGTDLSAALSSYLSDIDDEKSDWFSEVMRNVNTYKELDVDLPEGETFQTMTDEELEAEMDFTGADFYNEWSCGYGQEWNQYIKDAEGNNVGGCVDTAEYKKERYGGILPEFVDDPDTGYGFREDIDVISGDSAICGIGMIWDGQACVPALEGLEADDYGLLCEEVTECPDGSRRCDAEECPEVSGCTDPEATNYSPDATADDDSCEYPEIRLGCTNATATNYDPDATRDNGTCTYAGDGDGDGDGDDGVIYGCTDEAATNFDPNATHWSDVCTYDTEDMGCECRKTDQNDPKSQSKWICDDPFNYPHGRPCHTGGGVEDWDTEGGDKPDR